MGNILNRLRASLFTWSSFTPNRRYAARQLSIPSVHCHGSPLSTTVGCSERRSTGLKPVSALFHSSVFMPSCPAYRNQIFILVLHCSVVLLYPIELSCLLMDCQSAVLFDALCNFRCRSKNEYMLMFLPQTTHKTYLKSQKA